MKLTTLGALSAVAASLLLTGCNSNRQARDLAYVERPVEALYNAAAQELDRGDYVSAIELFNEVERQHPYSEWARRSTMMSAYASYRSRRYDDAVSTAQRYLSLNPAGQTAPYAYYIIAMSYFQQIVDVGRDQKTTELALNALTDVVRRFPNTDYARDASVKIDMVRDQLAGKEMEIGRWYLRRNEHLAAVNRFKTVVDEYDTTTHTPEALHRLVEAYLSLGLTDQAVAAASVLQYNYPDSRWYRDSYDLIERGGSGAEPASSDRTLLQRLTPW
ncbi:outer membrane protein assembly factor BamD [Henriciella litoralis]|uniref:outer membrane protein assembly factor BamD n=1 Tax=Henriciella litoralis TaxID=568102 RepID=UPI0009FEF1F2|nr:outer membrane protein assembly factor BamD [Henriciella litoralis]